MSYGTVEDALLTTIRRTTIWNTTNTGASEWDMLNNGKSRYLVTRPGQESEVSKISISGAVTRTGHNVIVEIWQIHKDQKDVRRLLDSVEKTIAKVEAYPFLGKGQTGNIHMAEIVSVGEVEARWASEAKGPNWLVQEVVMMCTEERRTTLAE